MAFPLQFLLETALPHLLMGKDKKKHSKKDKVSEDILDVAAISLKKFRKVSKEMSKLSTGQKVVGGVALLAAGLSYLASREADDAASVKATPGAGAAEALLAKLGAPKAAGSGAAAHQEASQEEAHAAEPRKRKKASRES